MLSISFIFFFVGVNFNSYHALHVTPHLSMPRVQEQSCHKYQNPNNKRTKTSFLRLSDNQKENDQVSNDNDAAPDKISNPQILVFQSDGTLIDEVIDGDDNNSIELSNRKSFQNKMIALSSIFMAFAVFIFQHSQPSFSNVSLLKAMAKESPDIKTALCNGKPSIFDFYADWCENCKVMAPTMRQLEHKYGKVVNFFTIDGSNPANSALIGAFKVDGIPHLAFVTRHAEVQTALIGTVPKSIITEEIDALIAESPLPYEGFNAFASSPNPTPTSNIIFPEIQTTCAIR